VDWPALARRTMQGDEAAAVEIINALEPKISAATRKYRVGPDRDDAVAECLLVLWEKLLPHFVLTGCHGDFPSFCYIAFYHRLAWLRRQARRLKRGAGTVPVDILDTDPDNTATNPATIVADAEAAANTLQQINDAATPALRIAIPHLQNGYSYAEVDRMLNQKPNATGMAVWALRQKLNIEKQLIEQVTDAGEVIGRYPSARAAEKATGIDHSQICNVLARKKKYQHAGGYRWRYASTGENK